MTELANPQINVQELKSKYSLDVFIETGCFNGNGLRHATSCGFNQLYSCDINKIYADGASQEFSNACIKHQDSLAFFQDVLPQVSGRALFFLDAHFPSFYFKPDAENENTKFPLFEEVKLIKQLKENFHQDVIICDDLRVLAPQGNPFHVTDLEQYYYVNYTIADLITLLKDTHQHYFVKGDTGTIIFVPIHNAAKPWGYLNLQHDPQALLQYLSRFADAKQIDLCELGVAQGKTANRLVDYLKMLKIPKIRYYGIDNLNLHNNFPLSQVGRPIFEHEEMTFIEGDREELLKLPKMDFAFVDACHCAECVVHDSILMSKLIKKGGSMAFHDTSHLWQYPHGSTPFDFWQHVIGGRPSRPMNVLEGITMSRTMWDGDWELIVQSGDDMFWGGIRVYKKL